LKRTVRFKTACLGFFLAAGLNSSFLARAEESKTPKPSGIFSFFLENDVFAGTDRGYTSGLKFVWVSPGLNGDPATYHLPRWLDFLSRKLPLVQTPGSQRFVSVFAGQKIYTPNDIERSDLIAWDRPYAGMTYAGLGFHRMGLSFMDTVELNIGIVGPHSFAGDVQRFVHKIFGWTPANGWAHQLKDEAVLGFVCDHKWKVWQSEREGSFGSDLIVHGGGELSNALTGASTGFEFRAGWNIPNDFGTSRIQPGSDSSSLFEERDLRRSGRSRLGFHFFLALEGHGVLRDIFLDGNTFRKSHSVEKIPFRADIAMGFALRYKRLKLNCGYVYQTKQFATQTKNAVYGSLQAALVLLD